MIGFSWIPNQFPFNKILVFDSNFSKVKSFNKTKSLSSKICFTGSSHEPIVIFAVNAKFFTIPTDWPSGVSDGHKIPICVLCNCLGLINLPDLSIGVFNLRRCDNVAE